MNPTSTWTDSARESAALISDGSAHGFPWLEAAVLALLLWLAIAYYLRQRAYEQECLALHRKRQEPQKINGPLWDLLTPEQQAEKRRQPPIL